MLGTIAISLIFILNSIAQSAYSGFFRGGGGAAKLNCNNIYLFKMKVIDFIRNRINYTIEKIVKKVEFILADKHLIKN